MMNVEFLEPAQEELDEAIEYYNQQQSGLGIDFLSEIIDSLGRISDYPDAWQKLAKRTRRCLVNCFPYGVIYQKRNDMILVVAVANLHRKPTYWYDRI